MTDLLHQAYDPEQFRQQGHKLVDTLADYLTKMQDDPRGAVLPWQSSDDQLYSWEEDYRQSPQDDMNKLWEVVLEQSIHIHHPRYVGHQVSPPAPAAALAGLLSAFLNNGSAVYEMGPVATALERLVMQELAQKVGYGPGAGGVMTSGGTLSNLTALLSARQAQAGYDAWQQGSQESFALLVSEQAHYCIDRAAKIMGWGDQGVIKVPADDQFKMRTDLLEEYYQRAQAGGLRVIAVVGSASSTATGAYDPLEEIADFCQQHQLWFHIDGAHGAPAALSQKYRTLTQSMARADSITVDFHKMMLTPALTTGLLFKDEQYSYRTFAQQASYLLNDQEGEWYNGSKRTFECTKRMMSVQVYTLLRTYGWQVFDDNVTLLYDLARTFAHQIQARPSLQLALMPEANIVCFRYTGKDLPEEMLNEVNAKIRQEMLEDGRFYLVQTQLREHLFLRTTLMNPFTTEVILEELLDGVVKLGEQYAKQVHRPETLR